MRIDESSSIVCSAWHSRGLCLPAEDQFFLDPDSICVPGVQCCDQMLLTIWYVSSHESNSSVSEVIQSAREIHCECTDDGGGTLVAFLVGHWTLTRVGLVMKDILIPYPHPPHSPSISSPPSQVTGTLEGLTLLMQACCVQLALDASFNSFSQ